MRKLARKEVDGEERRVEVLYPSMYFGFEQQKRAADNYAIPNTRTAVSNIYVNGVRFAAITSGNKTRYYHTDQVDSVSLVTDEDGSAVHRFEYLPYGEAWKKEKNTKVGTEEHNPKYNSQELDTETNFYYYNARYYDSEICRFVTADPVVDGVHSLQGWNGYMFVQGNPIVYKDPTGKTSTPLSSMANSNTFMYLWGFITGKRYKKNIDDMQKASAFALKELTGYDKVIDAYKNGDNWDKAIATLSMVGDLLTGFVPKRRIGTILFNLAKAGVDLVGAGKAGINIYNKTYNALKGKETPKEIKRAKKIAYYMAISRVGIKLVSMIAGYGASKGLNKLFTKFNKRISVLSKKIEENMKSGSARSTNENINPELLKLEDRIEKFSEIIASHLSRLLDRKGENFLNSKVEEKSGKKK